MKKKLGAILLVVALALALVLPVAPAAAHVEGAPQESTLFAGQDIDVGTVSVWNDATTLYVKYETTGGWEMTETHLQVADTLGGIPQTTGGKKGIGTAGNPIPGQFSDGAYYDPPVTEDTFEFDIIANEWVPCETDLFIAAHAVVEKCVVEQFEFVPELSWQRSSEEAVAVFAGYGAQWTKAQGLAIPLDSGTLVWDGGTGGQYFTGYSTRSDISWASWECTQNPSGKSLTGTDLRRFQAAFDIPVGYSVTGGTLGSVNAGCEDVIPMNDNIYIFVNEELIFWGGTISVLDPGTTHFLGMERRPTQPQHSHIPDFPETDGWYMSGAIPAISSSLFVEGTNVLDVFAEEFWTGGGMHELGLTLQVEQTTCETETAWGAGIDFPGKNWATYIEYHVQPFMTLEASENATADWVTTETHSGDYSVYLSVPTVDDYAEVCIDLTLHSPSIALSAINLGTTSFWCKSTEGDYIPYFIFEMEGDYTSTADILRINNDAASSAGYTSWAQFVASSATTPWQYQEIDKSDWSVKAEGWDSWANLVSTYGTEIVTAVLVENSGITLNDWGSYGISAYVDDITVNGTNYGPD